MRELPALLACPLKLFDGQAEEAAHPFPFEELVGIAGSGLRQRRQLVLRELEIERQHGGAAAALEPACRPGLVGDKRIDARPQERPQPGALRVVAGEKVLLDNASEELLRQVLGILLRFKPVQADVFVHGFPSPVSPSVPVRHNENYMPDESSRLTAFVERVCSSGTLFSLSEASCVVRKKNTRTSAGLEQPSGPNP